MENLMGQGADGKPHPLPSFGRTSTTVRASAILLNTGAYVGATAWTVPDGVKKVSIVGTYTRGTSGGRAILRLKWTVASIAAYDTTRDEAISTSGPDASSSFYRTIILCPIPSDASALSFVLDPVDVPPGATSLQVEAAEADATKASPGTLLLAVAAGS